MKCRIFPYVFCTVVALPAVMDAVLAQQAPYDVFPAAEPPYYRVRYEGSDQPHELKYAVNYTIWIPSGIKTVRGVIVHQHGCGEGSCKSGLTGAFDLHWQALARKHGCALLGPSYEQPDKADCQLWCDPRNGSDAAFQKCLVDLGEVSGHPELATVPWALWGHSGGGHWAGGMVLLHPDRVAAAWLRSGVPLLEPNPERLSIKAHELPDAALKVPVMCNPGTKEGVTVKDGRFAGVWPANEAFFTAVRSRGGLIGVAVDPLTAHECGNQRYLAIPWLHACLTARLPESSGAALRPMPTESAWLAAPTGTEAVPAASYAGNVTQAAWLPGKAVATAWMQYVKDTAVADTTAPPAATNLRVSGNQLTWSASADLESGLAHFIVQRDGQFLARLPETGRNPFGRPIFQNLQYSDTPTQPLVPMRFIDTTAVPGRQHTYEVVAVNTVGLQSQPTSASDSVVSIGAATQDITPEYPVRLTGYGNRATEATEAAVQIHARALVIGAAKANNRTAETSGGAVLITVDNCGVPAAVTEAVFDRITATHNIQREQFAICSTHTHSGPWLRGFAPNILTSLPADQAAHLQQYEADLIAKLVTVVDSAFAAIRPGRLSIGRGQVGFAMNRRTLQDGRWTGFGETPDGPVDHQFPVLAAHDTQGELIAVLANYACHATTETGEFNKISGDWPGFAADMIEDAHPNAVALIAIGCGADANPSPRGTHQQAEQHGRTVADEVQRLLASSLTTIDPAVTCRMDRIELPLGPLPTRETWEQQATESSHAGALAQRFLEMLDDGKTIPTSVPGYPVQTWCFGGDLAMVFLGGEVVVDYAIRLNNMFDDARLWINAYSNDVPCYIASKRLLREGGYEVDRSMVYYAHPTRLAPEAEDLICDTVQRLLPHRFYSSDLQATFPGPRSPEESLACITARPGLQVELVAAEPLITDPVAFDWDPSGHLWVVEMSGYPAGTPRRARAEDDGMVRATGNAPRQAKEKLGEGPGAGNFSGLSDGRVRVLADTDEDGRYDTAVTFLDELNFPTGIHPWRDGWIITAAPDIIYAEDTDGDFQADIRKVLFTGFTEGNQQHRVNGLRWGLDGWLYLANGDSGGSIRPVSAVADGVEISTEPVNISGRDLRIQPDTGQIETLSGQTQSGRNRDDFGNWFGNNNSNPIWHYVLEDRYLRRNPHAVSASPKAQVAAVPGAAPVFPASQTLARFNDFGSANRFTSACSTAIYRDNLLGQPFYGNAFTCEPVHNLVSRLVMERDGVTFQGRRAEDEQESEFFASSDNWTRPVMVRTGPDGALYVADMYRQVIEHPQWIPPEYQRKLDLRAGEDRGRIYRIAGTPRPAVALGSGRLQTASESPTKPVRAEVAVHKDGTPDLRAWIDDTATGLLPVNQLVERMSSPNGWWRDTAQRLLLRHRPADAVERLTILAQTHSVPAVRAQALHTVVALHEGSSALADPVIHAALQDSDAEVRRTALQYVRSPYPKSVWDMVDDDSLAVRHQLALELLIGQPESAPVMARLLLQNSTSPEIIDAAMTSLKPGNVGSVLQSVMASDGAPAALIGSLIAQAAAMQQLNAVRDPVLQMLQQLHDNAAGLSPARWKSIAAILDSLQRSAGGKALLLDDGIRSVLTLVRHDALVAAMTPEQSDDVRTAALTLASIGETLPEDAVSSMFELLTPANSNALQQAAVGALLNASPEAVSQLYEHWKTLTPAVRDRVLQHAQQSPSASKRLLEAVAAKTITGSDLNASVREQLLSHRVDDVRRLAKTLLGETSPSARAAVVERLKSEMSTLKADAGAGKAVFEKRCSTCHRLQDVGKQIGADLAALKDRSTEALLTAILDPNKAVEAKFLSYTAVTAEGQTFSGMLLNETANSVTLLGMDGKQQVVARTELEDLVCSNRSLMPEGLEKDLTNQQLADVISFVQSSGVKWKTFDGNAPQVVTANGDGTITLPAAAAEIYGPNLVFEGKHGNLGWWTSTDDYAVWTIDVPRGGYWTVEVDYACDNSTAGNIVKLSTGTRLLTVRVPGSGTWDDYKSWTAGEIDLGGGRRQLIVTAPEQPTGALIDLKAIRLIPPE